MNPVALKKLLDEVAGGSVTPEAALERLKSLPFEDLGFAKVDHHRNLRKGYPETIFAMGKTPEQVSAIVDRLRAQGANVLATRCTPETAAAVLGKHPDAVYHDVAWALTITVTPPEPLDGYVAVVCAGTTDIPVAEEAVVTCESLGARVERVYDIGIAGIHRLLRASDTLNGAHAVIVCAGMEGALPSAVAGIIEKPVVAVPTSIGYGASFGGIAALLGMLNSCATGVAVVNIDNGFGAGIYAATITRLVNGK